MLDSGAVVLTANDRWWGAAPITERITVWPRGVDVQDKINGGIFHVVDVATGSSGTLSTPDDYESVEFPSAGIEQLIFAPRDRWGPGGPPGDGRLHSPRPDCRQRQDADRQLEAQPGQRRRLQRSRIRPAVRPVQRGRPRYGTVRHRRAATDGADRLPGAQPRLAATVAAITQACLPAGITVVDATTETTGPQTLRDGGVDVLLASTGGAVGSGSTGSSAMDAYALHTGNGNNLSGYSNPQIDGIISALAVTTDPKEIARLLGDAAPILWTDVPTLPLYRQERTLLRSKKMFAVGAQPDQVGPRDGTWTAGGWSREPPGRPVRPGGGDRRADPRGARLSQPGVLFRDSPRFWRTTAGSQW